MEGFFGLPSDVLIVVGVLAVTLVYNYTIGKHRAATLLIAMYVAGALIFLVPAFDALYEILPVDKRFSPVIMFGVVLILVYLIFRRNAFFDPYLVPTGWELGVFSVLHTAVLVALVVSIVPSAVTADFSPNFGRVFLDPMVRSGLIVAPLLMLFVIRGRD